MKYFKDIPKLLFIDDVHPESQEATDIVPVNIDWSATPKKLSEDTLWIIEIVNMNNQVTLDRPTLHITPDFIILESEMTKYTRQVIEILSWLPRKKRYKFREWFWWFCGEQKILHSLWTPTCIGYDVGLTYFKDTILWFDSWVNVLSKVYHEQQLWVNRVYQKVNPNFDLQQFYY